MPGTYPWTMPGTPRYTLADWDPKSGQSMEEWALELREQGWRTWAGPGSWATINGRRVWRVELRMDEPVCTCVHIRAHSLIQTHTPAPPERASDLRRYRF